MIRWFAPFLLAASLAGCTSGGSDGFPSLAPRATETRGFDEPTPAPATPVRPDPALDARIAEVRARLAERERQVGAARARAESQVTAAKGAAVGSERWLDAQVALGELDVAMSGGGEAVTTLEQLAADRGVAGEPPYPALDAALADARAAQEASAAATAALNARLSR
jgi:hypothetical protein